MKSGVKRSRIDIRDYIAEHIFHTERLAGSSQFVSHENLPSEYNLFEDNYYIGGNNVYNQGDSYKCVAYVASTIREKQVFQEISSTNPLRNDGLTWPNQYNHKMTFSKDYIYDLRNNRMSNDANGMSGADAMEILTNYGCIEEKDYNEYLKLHQQNNNPIAKEKLNQMVYRIKKMNGAVYSTVISSQGLKDSLYHNGPCLMILPFYGSNHDQFWLPDRGQSKVDEMGHAVTVVGYSDAYQSFYLRNTWGPNWGPNKNGHVWYPYELVDDKKKTGTPWELWTIFPSGTEHLKNYLNTVPNSYNNTQQQQFAGQPLKKLSKIEKVLTDLFNDKKKLKKLIKLIIQKIPNPDRDELIRLIKSL